MPSASIGTSSTRSGWWCSPSFTCGACCDDGRAAPLRLAARPRGGVGRHRRVGALWVALPLAAHGARRSAAILRLRGGGRAVLAGAGLACRGAGAWLSLQRAHAATPDLAPGGSHAGAPRIAGLGRRWRLARTTAGAPSVGEQPFPRSLAGRRRCDVALA